jgi:hypothetical protein
MQERILAFALLLVMAGPLGAEVTAVPGAEKGNPHGAKGKCEVCHQASEDTLTGWFTFSSTKKKMRMDLNSLCRQCHGVQFGHGVGKHTEMNLKGLPMDVEGKITCAITCHNMHVKSTDPVQSRYHLRLPKNTLCLSCHNP